jgi:hypothetical protein
MIAVSAVEIKGVFLMPAIVMPGTDMEKEFAFWEVAGYSVLLMLSWFFLVGCYRQLIRKAKKMEVYDKGSQKSLFSRFSKYVSLLSLYLIFAWIACILWSILGYWVTGWIEFISFGIFGSACFICFARAYTYFALNDFEYLQDVEKLNKRIDRHNVNIGELEKRKADIQQKLADGTLLLPKLPPKVAEIPPPPPPPPPPPAPPAPGEGEEVDEAA